MRKNVIVEECHKKIMEKTKQVYAFDENKDLATWKKELKEKFIELSGIADIEQNACPLNFEIEEEVQMEGYKRIRFTIESEIGAIVPCYVLIPDGKAEKLPVVITLQGHSSGFHNSIGEVKFAGDIDYQPRGQFAVQAVREGYIAVAIEQRAMGECRARQGNHDSAQMCSYEANNAFLLGRTIVGERTWDISKVIDALANFSECDLDKIVITGNSGGGTTTFYAACYDERIKMALPSCAYCTYAGSIMDIFHCSCNYIPSAFKYFEMQDLSGLIAPRTFIPVAGKNDVIFPIEEVRKAFETTKKIYALEGAEENCRLIETPKGHWWCVDIMWPTIKEEMKKLGWIKQVIK